MRAFRGRAGFEQLCAPWEELTARMKRVRFVQHPAWYRSLFAASLANPEDFLFVGVDAGGELLGVCPLHVSRQRVAGMAIDTVGSYLHPHMALNDFVFDDSAAGSRLASGLMVDLLRWLTRERPIAWDVLMLEKIALRSVIARALNAHGPMNLMMLSALTGVSAYLATDSEESALGPVSNSFKRNLRRLAKRAEAGAPLRYEVCETAASLPPALSQFMAIEASGWKGAGASAIAQRPELVRFYQSLAASFGASGACMIHILYHGENAIAANFGLLTGGVYNILKIGYEEAHASIAPGNLMMERCIRWCCARPDINEMSFVTGPAWSHLWKPRHDPVSSYRVFNPSLKGSLLHHALRAKRWYESRRRQPSPDDPAGQTPGADEGASSPTAEPRASPC